MEELVCGMDGILYKSYCELNRIVCILGVKDIIIYYYGSCKLSRYFVNLLDKVIVDWG